jgi:hypothetical protein
MCQLGDVELLPTRSAGDSLKDVISRKATTFVVWFSVPDSDGTRTETDDITIGSVTETRSATIQIHRRRPRTNRDLYSAARAATQITLEVHNAYNIQDSITASPSATSDPMLYASVEFVPASVSDPTPTA